MAVYTRLSREELEQLLHRYEIPSPTHFAPIAEGIENSNYSVTAGGRAYVLTVHERTGEEDVETVLRTMARLAEAGVRCPRPIPLADTSAAYVTRHGLKPVSLSPWVEGVTETEPDERQLEALGRAVGEFHCAGASMQLDRAAPHQPDLLVPTANRIAREVRERRADLAELLAAEADIQRRWETSPLPCGLVHADLFRDNVLFRADRPGVAAFLDFHLAGRGPWMYDLAVILLDFCWHTGGVNGDRARAVLRGYRSHRGVNGEEFQALPVLLRRAALRFLCLRVERFELEASGGRLGVRKDPLEMERKLRVLGGGRPVSA